MKIAIGSDHVGYKMKELIMEYLENQGIEIIDMGADSEERTDYPAYGLAVCFF
ncbi:hypothetical protein DI392_10365 [Vibrio albus]|uniref:Ribose-5-phosphate isomerase n=1 Tax=Vibrio albus TaxID=2200953 RepID=A0A2U3B967_9VIBR|nr:RpiB/LacA/LacB family sugar-phosphate isomerase [Vibrio albus]PWI33254.1 hypothetical protein DI392_10365 [Vibrio albus]